MAEVSRTARVIQNAKVALFFYCINLILQFFSRKIFLDYLGAELLGLNTTAQNLLQFLNLAESGIGMAVAFALYKPLSQKNRQEIIDIVSLQGWLYRWVGLFVIAGSIVLMAFFPWIFAKADVPLVYAYGTFVAFLISALLGYFINYKMIVLSADQKEYKITIENQSVKVIKVFIQMWAIWQLPHGYVWWMVLEVLGTIIISIRLNYCVKREYPWLKTNIAKGKELSESYPFLVKKTKQLFFHKLGGYVLGQTTPLVVYAFTSLTMVSIYGNYLLIMTGCLLLVNAFFRGVDAGVGNLVALEEKAKIKQVFWQLLTLRLFLAGLVCSGIWLLSESFVKLWVGQEYVLSSLPTAILTTTYFIQMTRNSDVFLSAYGLFHDIWAPVIESLLNISLSCVFGFFMGITGIFLGVLVSQLIIINTWKVYFLYKDGFQDSFTEYIALYTKKILILLVTCFVISFLMEDKCIDGFLAWGVSALEVIMFYTLVASVLFCLFDSSFREIIRRVYYRLM